MTTQLTDQIVVPDLIEPALIPIKMFVIRVDGAVFFAKACINPTEVLALELPDVTEEDIVTSLKSFAPTAPALTKGVLAHFAREGRYCAQFTLKKWPKCGKYVPSFEVHNAVIPYLKM